MIIDTGNILLIGAVLLFFSIIAGKAGFRFGVPVLLLFLGVGMLFGSDGLGIQFNNPHGAQFIGMIALSIILFSGGMDTKYTEIKPVLGQGVILATLGVALTTAITGFFIYWKDKNIRRLLIPVSIYILFLFFVAMLSDEFLMIQARRLRLYMHILYFLFPFNRSLIFMPVL